MNKTLQFVGDDIEQHYQEAPKTAQHRQAQGRDGSISGRRQSWRLESGRGRELTQRMYEANPELARSEMSQAELQQAADKLERGKQARLDALRHDYNQKDRALRREARQQHRNINEAYREAEGRLKYVSEGIELARQARLGNGNPPALQTGSDPLDVMEQEMRAELKERRNRQHASTDEGVRIARDMAKRDRDMRSASVETEVQLAKTQAGYSDAERATWQSEERSEAHAKLILDSSKRRAE